MCVGQVAVEQGKKQLVFPKSAPAVQVQPKTEVLAINFNNVDVDISISIKSLIKLFSCPIFFHKLKKSLAKTLSNLFLIDITLITVYPKSSDKGIGS